MRRFHYGGGVRVGGGGGEMGSSPSFMSQISQ
jgi:hypothetical protein